MIEAIEEGIKAAVFTWEKIYENLQQDLKLCLFILSVMCIFRVGFIGLLHSYLSEATTFQDILLALFYGVRISLKSAGLLAVVSVGVCLLAQLTHLKTNNCRYWLGIVYIAFLSILFYARIPYYEQFHASFNQLLFNTMADDVLALFQTLIQQYHLPLRLTLAGFTTWALAILLKSWLNLPIIRWPQRQGGYQKVAWRGAFLCSLYVLAIFFRFGGSLTYAHNVDWENAGVTKDHLLNEAILDDVQALYRAYELNERLQSSTGIDIDSVKMHDYGVRLASKNLESHDLRDYLKKTAQGLTAAKPNHVFLIISESYANWPLLPEYSSLNLASGMKHLIEQENAAYVPTFLPNGMSTISGLTGVITGLADVNLYLNYLPEAYQAPYETALAPQLKKLGYKPRFWYGGPSSWERIKDFTIAQGFDEFHGSGDFQSEAGNVWGSDDKYLFNAVYGALDESLTDFNVILTVSNHAPFTVDLAAEGFDSTQIKAALSAEQQNNPELIKQLGHFWYADKMLAQFVERTSKKYPNSLFMIVGDHADRLNLEANPGLYKRYGIPLIVYGQGVNKAVFSDQTVGSHIDVAPTLIELIAPRDFVYYSLGQSLTRGNDFGMNYGFWITRSFIGPADKDAPEGISSSSGTQPPVWQQLEDQINCIRSVSWWRIKKGNQF